MGRQLYELIPEEGKHLADSHDTEGAFRGVYLGQHRTENCVQKMSLRGKIKT